MEKKEIKFKNLRFKIIGNKIFLAYPKRPIKSISIGYPLSNELNYIANGPILEIEFTEDYQARLLEIQF